MKEEEIKKLKASLAAIHCHSSNLSSRFWAFVPKTRLAATLKTIKEECEIALPELRKIKK